MNRRIVLRLRALAGLLACAAFACGCEAPNRTVPIELRGATMGTTYSVKLLALPASLNRAELQAEIDERLERVNQQMSTYRDDSELSRFNRHDSTDWFAVSAETARVVQEALEIGAQSGGAFDPTVAPLVNLWSFGPEARPRQAPPQAEINRVRALTGLAQVEVRRDPPSLLKRRPDVTLELSGIAKGFGVDDVAACLQKLGVESFLVEIGGEVRARGARGDGQPWRIGIERPVAGRRGLQTIVALPDRSLATSGDYRNFFEENGRRYSHTIDPRTGRPVEHNLASVSVVAETCTSADGWATALMVLGPETGYNLAEEREVAALFIVREGDGFVERATSKFAELNPRR